jgi:hypothetical protein
MSTLLTLPLVAATSGTFGTVIAVIGAIKLGAAAILLKLAVARGYQNSALDSGAPAASYGAPAASYGAPAAEYGAPAPSYGAPTPSYGAPAPAYGAPKRHRRDVAYGSDTSPEGLFTLVGSLDMYSCGKSLICELEAKNPELLDEDERLIMTLFSDRKYKKNVDPASPKAEYDLAAELGMVSRSQVVCRQRYSTCPYTADEMMKALRTANI